MFYFYIPLTDCKNPIKQAKIIPEREEKDPTNVYRDYPQLHTCQNKRRKAVIPQ